MKATLEYLFEGGLLSREEAATHLQRMSNNQVSMEQMASFATVYRMRPITVPELQGFRDALLALRIPVEIKKENTVDIVGTGGDGKNTFNISTTSAFVIAGAGYPVTKHGSYGVSSNCGSSNVLMQLGYAFTNDSDALNRQLEAANICFFHAPLFHPAMKAAVPMRKGLKIKTFFNMLGPLVNPIQPRYQLFGTYNKEVAQLYHQLLQTENKNYTVVYADDGYDEISLTGTASIFQPNTNKKVSPDDFGLSIVHQKELYGGETVEEAATILTNVLSSKGTEAQTNAVMANSALAIQTIKPELSLVDAVAEARESLNSGNALNALKKLIETN